MQTSLRERGLRLQRRVTVIAVAASAVLAGTFAGIAAATSHSHSSTGTASSSDDSDALQPSVGDESQAPAAPQQAPQQSSSPPVASSGGS